MGTEVTVQPRKRGHRDIVIRHVLSSVEQVCQLNNDIQIKNLKMKKEWLNLFGSLTQLCPCPPSPSTAIAILALQLPPLQTHIEGNQKSLTGTFNQRLFAKHRDMRWEIGRWVS